jgi:hypothetical protein
MPTSWHLTSLTVLGGTLHGKKLAIEDAVVEVLVGSDPDCHLHLDLPMVSPIHARLWIEPDDVTVFGTRSGPGVFVNFDRVDGEGKVRPGDMLWLGPPQSAGSVMLQAHFEERDSLPPILMAQAEEASATEAPAPHPGATDELPPIPVSQMGDTPVELASIAEALGVRPPDETPLPQEPLPLEPQVVAGEAPPAPPASPGFEDFLVMEAPAPAAAPARAGDEFIVSGFEAEWPDAAPNEAGAAPAFASPKPPAEPPRPTTEPPKPTTDDVFFIDDTVVPPPTPGPTPAADTFFIDDLSLPPVGAPAPQSGAAIPAPAPVAPPAPAARRPPQGTEVADLDVSFAAAFLEAPKAEPAAPPAAAPPSKPTAPAPPKPKAAPTAPPLPQAPKAAPGVSQSVPRASVPPPSPSSTAAHRPLPRPDVSQAVARGARSPTPRGERTQPARPRRPSAPVGRYVAIGGITLAVLAGLAFLIISLMRAVSLEGIEPRRARVGETVALSGRGFEAAPDGNVVLFGEQEAKVAAASPTRLDVVVPDVAIAAGAEASVEVRVRVGRAESKAVLVSVFAGPVLHGISPDVAMPGEEVVLAGSGWGLGPSVRFGGLAAEVVEVRETSIRVRVPAIEGGAGTAAPVVVSSGLAESNAGPFYVGRIPLVIKAEPTTVAPGDVVTLGGRGFRRERTQNSVQVGSVRALVVSALDGEIKVVIPRVPPGSRTLEVRVPSSVAPAQVPLVVTGLGETVGFRFVAEPFDGAPGRDHAVLATGVGPAFVLASSGGRSSAERAFEAARRMNDAAATLAAAPDLSFELRDADSRPTLGLAGRPEVLLEVTDEDAGAYAEDWTGLRGRGGPVSAGRLGRWWEAVARDLVLLLVRGARPHFAADMAPEGRAFLDLFQAAQRGGGLGAEAVAQTRPALREALRLVALRVPPTVRGPVTAPVAQAPSAAAATATAESPMPRLEGTWTGSEDEQGTQRYLTVNFRGTTGTIAYEGIVTVSAPLRGVEEPRRGAVRFSVEVRGGLRYYSGRWDGRALKGALSLDAAGAENVGTFELRPR